MPTNGTHGTHDFVPFGERYSADRILLFSIGIGFLPVLYIYHTTLQCRWLLAGRAVVDILPYCW